MKRVFLYVRVSTEEQAIHGLSIEAQAAALETWAKENSHRVVGVYTDAGISARKPASKRPALQRLLEDVRAGKGDMVVFTKLDRWFRSVGQYYQVQDVLEKHGVSWRAIHEDYETATASGRLKVNIMLSVAQDEADRTSERIKAVFENKRAKNETLGGRLPKGYKLDGKRVVLDEATAPIVRSAFDMYFETGAIYKIIQAFPELHLNYYSARYMFASPSYAGDMNGVEIPAIITPDEHKRAASMHGTVVRKTKENRVYLFSGLIVCPECGRRMAGRSCQRRHSATVYYNCPGYMFRKGCGNKKSYNESMIERFLLDHLEDAIGMISSGKAEDLENTKPKRDALKKKLSRLSELYVDEIISKDDYRRQYQDLIAQLESIPETLPKVNIESIKRQISTGWKDAYEELGRTEKQIFWRNAVKKIRLTSDSAQDFDLAF